MRAAAPAGEGAVSAPAAGTARPTIGLTGASGFIGRRIATTLGLDGYRVRALIRRPNAELAAHAQTVRGDLADEAALAALVDGVSAVIHCAGAVRARSAAEFHQINAQPAGTLGRLCAARGVRLVLVSSLAARAPELSAYAASKREAEKALGTVDGLDWCAIRPPLVYGPGDRATLPLFRAMRRGWLPVPAGGGGRFSAIHADDLAAAIVRLASGSAQGIFDIADGKATGYGWRDMAAVAAAHLKRPVRCVPVPRPAMQAVATVNMLASRLTRAAPMVSSGKVRELYHIDWVCSGENLQHATGWQPRLPLAEGVAQTFRWYGAQGWL